MPNKIEWNKPIITVNEIESILTQQYGPEQNIKIWVDDKSRPVRYNSCLLNCECLRCGRKFSYTPMGLVNSLYTNGFICTECGMLSNDELKAKRDESRRLAAIQTIKDETGIDVVEEEMEAEDEEKEYSKNIVKETEDYASQMKSILEQEQQEEEIKKEELRSKSQENSNPINVEGAKDEIENRTDSDDKSRGGEEDKQPQEASGSRQIEETSKPREPDRTVEQTSMQQPSTKGNVEPESVEEKSEIVENKDESSIEKELDINNNEVKSKENEVKEMGKSRYEADDSDMKFSIGSLIKNNSEEVDDQDVISMYDDGKEELSDIDEDDDLSNIADDEPSDTEDDESDDDGVLGVESAEVTSEPEVEVEPEPEEIDEKLEIAGVVYNDMDELADVIAREGLKAKDELGISPWYENKDEPIEIDGRKCSMISVEFDTENPDTPISARCRSCGETVSFHRPSEIGRVVPLDKVLAKLGVKYDPNKHNNSDGSIPKVTLCPHCLESIRENGYNHYHRASLIKIAKKSHFFISDRDNHYFCRTKEEAYEVECNGVKIVMPVSEIYKHFGHGEDARESGLFVAKEEPKIEKPVTVKKSSVVMSEESYVQEPKASSVNVEEITVGYEVETVAESKNIHVDSEKKSIFSSNDNVNVEREEIKIKDEKPITVKIVSESHEPEVKKEEPKVIKIKSTSTVDTGSISIDTSKTKKETAAEAISRESLKEEKKVKIESKENHSSIFSSSNIRSDNGSVYGKSKDTINDLDNERKAEEERANRKSIFSESPSLKRSIEETAVLNGKINPFEKENDLRSSFQSSIFYDFVEELAEKTETEYKLILDNRTYEIPIIDFESGIRLMCVDLNDPPMYNVLFEQINNAVRFSYTEKYAKAGPDGVLRKQIKKHTWVPLYSDSIEYARNATIYSLVKFINPRVLPYGKKKIQLQDNLTFQYTTNSMYLTDFDKRYSTFPSIKPCTGKLGIIARWNSTKSSTAKDAMRVISDMNRGTGGYENLDTLESNYNEYMVASIKYIETCRKDVVPNKIVYNITEYVEIGSAFIADGLMQCIRALLHEYKIKYPQLANVSPYIVVEIDPNCYVTPAIKSYIDRGTLCKVTPAFNNLVEGSFTNRGVDKYLRYYKIRRPEYRQDGSSLDFQRQDLRMFQVGTLINRMGKEIKECGLSNTIRNHDVRETFIRRFGYVNANQAEIKKYYVNDLIVSQILNDGFTLCLQKHADADGFMQKTAMVTDSNAGIGINNILNNPSIYARYNNIMTNGTKEAKAYLNSMLWEQQNQFMMDYAMNHSNAPQNAGSMFAQGNPNMSMGMNPMMGGGMPGMMNNPMGMGMPGMGMNPMGGMFGY